MLGSTHLMTPSKKAATIAAFGSLMTFSAVSFAHVDLSQPTPRAHGETEGDLKSGPCGQTTNARTANVTVFAPGETITVEWNEYIDHPAYYRIAFDDDGDDGFAMRTDGQSDPTQDNPVAMEEALGMDAEILAIVTENDDTTPGVSTDVRSMSVTMPNIECENCTLQVIQYMYNNPAQGYFQCADIALRAAQGVEPGDAGVGGGSEDAGSGGAGGSANAGTAGNGGAPAAAGTAGTGGSGSNVAGTGGATSTAGAGGAPASAGSSALPAGNPADIDNEDDGGCSIPAHVGTSTITPALLGLLGLALGALGRRRRSAR
jgi:MYXO-CTERM domain-containing protein